VPSSRPGWQPATDVTSTEPLGAGSALRDRHHEPRRDGVHRRTDRCREAASLAPYGDLWHRRHPCPVGRAGGGGAAREPGPHRAGRCSNDVIRSPIDHYRSRRKNSRRSFDQQSWAARLQDAESSRDEGPSSGSVDMFPSPSAYPHARACGARVLTVFPSPPQRYGQRKRASGRNTVRTPTFAPRSLPRTRRQTRALDVTVWTGRASRARGSCDLPRSKPCGRAERRPGGARF